MGERAETPRWEFIPGKGCRLNDSLYIIKKLVSLFEDKTASKMVHRQLILLNEYIQISRDGFLMRDIPHLVCALKYLASQLEIVKEYRIPFQILLLIGRLPPLLEKSSETLFCSRDLQEYFTLLGYFIAIIRDEPTQLMVIDALHCLLTRYVPANIACVKLGTCVQAMEESYLPCTIAELLEVSAPNVFSELLDLTIVMVKASDKFCHRMIECGALDALILRLDPQYYYRDPAYPPPDPRDVTAVPNSRTHQSNMALSCHILWNLLKSVQHVKDKAWIKSPSQHALWSLRFVLRLSTRRAEVRLRNDLTGLILFSLYVIPDFLVVESGLAEDIAMLAVFSELGAPNSWAENLTFSSSTEDVVFKKMLLQSLCFLSNIPAAVEIFRQNNVMVGVLDLVNPGLNSLKVKWKAEQRSALTIAALRSLSFLIPVLTSEFIKHQGPTRTLLMMSLYLTKPYDLEVLHSCVRTVTKILCSGDKKLQDEYRDQAGVSVMGYLCNKALAQHFYRLNYQRLMTYLFVVLEILVRGNSHYRQLYGERAMELLTAFLHRMLKMKPGDSRPDSRLVIAMIDFLWEVVIWHPPNLKMFVRSGYFYPLMDIMKSSPFPDQLIVLSTLVDMVDQGDCIPHLVTWRDLETQQGYLPTLTEMWRQEEARCRVKRTGAGSIADIEMPLMGEDQWYHTFYRKKDPTTSPATVDILGSVRPKIYAILQLIKQRHSEKVDISQEYYHMNYQPLSVVDQVTLQLAENYFALKLGEVWSEVAQDLDTVGIKPIGADGEVIAVLTQRQRQCAACVLAGQQDILAAGDKEEQTREKQLYSELNEYKLAPTLKAMRELDLNVRTAEYEILRSTKKRQGEQIERLLQFPHDSPENCRHRTYPDKLNVTAMPCDTMIMKSVTGDASSISANDDEDVVVKKILPPKVTLQKIEVIAPHSKW